MNTPTPAPDISPTYRIRWRALNSGVTGQSSETYTEAEARANCATLNRLNPSIHNWFVLEPIVIVEPETATELRQLNDHGYDIAQELARR